MELSETPHTLPTATGPALARREVEDVYEKYAAGELPEFEKGSAAQKLHKGMEKERKLQAKEEHDAKMCSGGALSFFGGVQGAL